MAKVVNAIIIENNTILTVKRNKEPYIGMYSLPGGHVEQGETEVEAVIRELKEETNQDIEIIGHLDTIHNNNNECSIFFAKIKNKNNYSFPKEISEVKWLLIEDFIKNLEQYNPENWQLLLRHLNLK